MRSTAVPYRKSLATETRRLEARSVLFEKLAEQEGLLAELNGVAIIGKEVLEFVAKYSVPSCPTVVGDMIGAGAAHGAPGFTAPSRVAPKTPPRDPT